MNTQAERDALVAILSENATAIARQVLEELSGPMTCLPMTQLCMQPEGPGLLMTTVYAQLTQRAPTWCESAVAQAHQAARDAHQVIPDHALSRSEQRRRALALRPFVTEELFSLCQALVWREVTQARQGTLA